MEAAWAGAPTADQVALNCPSRAIAAGALTTVAVISAGGGPLGPAMGGFVGVTVSEWCGAPPAAPGTPTPNISDYPAAANPQEQSAGAAYSGGSGYDGSN
jgi:hypothetical protein